MTLTLAIEPMAKKKPAKPPVKREDVLTRIHPRALDDAKTAASFRGMSLVDYVSQVVQQAADRDIEEGYQRRKSLKED